MREDARRMRQVPHPSPRISHEGPLHAEARTLRAIGKRVHPYERIRLHQIRRRPGNTNAKER